MLILLMLMLLTATVTAFLWVTAHWIEQDIAQYTHTEQKGYPR